MIKFDTPRHHWNYYLAIEKDLENLARYIEFSNANLNTYSIELTHILLSASSEIDVIMKRFCILTDPKQKVSNINDYRRVIQNNYSQLILEEISIDRYGIVCQPWINWAESRNPNWWGSYNKVKHQRNVYFNEANLQNSINAVGALLITVIYYYRIAFSIEAGHNVNFRETTRLLQPEASFIRVNADYYYHNIIG